MIVGIDLGTTNSAVGYMSESGPKLIPNALGEVLTPSIVGIDEEGHLLVGSAAKELQVINPDRVASKFKRYMGTDWTVELDQKKFTPEKLSSLVLQSLKQDAEAHFGHAVNRAVISVPAYFNEHQRKSTLEAGRIAGFKVERILNEPTAAAIAYGLHQLDEEKLMIVFDLGGGTFDVSVVELFEGTMEVRASSGESFLGGEDFTTTLTARVLERRGYVYERAELEMPLLVSRLARQCDLAKCKLSREPEVKVRIPDAKGSLSDNSPEETITREQFGQWTQNILSRVDLPIRRALGDAGLKRTDIDEVILVGGATRMPQVLERVRELFGCEPRCRLNPDEVVALGASVQAGLIAKDSSLEELVVTDVSPFTLGISISRQFGMDHRSGYFLPIINRNTTLPVSRVDRVATIDPNQTKLTIKIYQGESRKVEDNLFLGEFTVDGIPRGPAGQAVDIRFTYDLNGVLEVEATIVETKKKVSHLVTRHARGLTADQIQQAVLEMQGIKTHPREEAANRFLMRRAERLYQELALMERQQLEMLLDGFEEAMELGDKESMEKHREVLEAFLERHDPQAGNEDEHDYEGW